MASENNTRGLLIIDDDTTRVEEIKSELPSYWEITHIEEVIEDTKTAADLGIEKEIDCVIISTSTLSTDETTVESMFHSIFGVVESIPTIVYGATFTDTIYKYAYKYDVKQVITVTDNSGLDELNEGIITTSAITAVDIHETTFSVAQSIMSANDDELDMKSNWALQSLGERFNATHCTLYACSNSDEMLRKQYSWEAEDASEITDDVIAPIGRDKIAADDFPGFEDVLSVFSPVCYDEHNSNANELTGKTGTVLGIPLVINWELEAVFIIRTPVQQHWTEKIQTQLEAVSELILHTDRRREQRAELEAQNERLEQFNSVISHDLQNPLSIAKGYIELAEETGDVSKLSTALDAVTRMENMITELLTLARQGTEIGETEEHSLREVASEAKSHVEVPDGEIRVDGVPEDVTVECDFSRVRELFENLFRNAVDHCGKDVIVTVTINDAGEIIVGDDGPGVPEAKREKIFEHGYTGGDGTGFGLAIVQRVVDAHEWDIRVGESDAGGAAFIIDPTLPDELESESESK